MANVSIERPMVSAFCILLSKVRKPPNIPLRITEPECVNNPFHALEIAPGTELSTRTVRSKGIKVIVRAA